MPVFIPIFSDWTLKRILDTTVKISVFGMQTIQLHLHDKCKKTKWSLPLVGEIYS